mgnify:CR=1 FL=1
MGRKLNLAQRPKHADDIEMAAAKHNVVRLLAEFGDVLEMDAMDAAGEQIQLALSLAEIFGGDIDFQSDLQPGDRVEVLVEKYTHDGAFAGYGPILAATLFGERRERTALRWIDRTTGKGTYYHADARSLKRFMLRSPLLFQPRVTSGFSRSRLHPVFRASRGGRRAESPRQPRARR